MREADGFVLSCGEFNRKRASKAVD